jgi:hypothetical protein
MMSPETEMVPMNELVDLDTTYICSKNLFPFVNRSLNAIGLQARIIIPAFVDVDEFPIRFRVSKNEGPSYT